MACRLSMISSGLFHNTPSLKGGPTPMLNKMETLKRIGD